MSVAAPRTADAISDARPTPPRPITATALPWATGAVLKAAPAPVATPHPTSEAMSSGMSGSIGMTARPRQFVAVPKLDTPIEVNSGVPPTSVA